MMTNDERDERLEELKNKLENGEITPSELHQSMMELAIEGYSKTREGASGHLDVITRGLTVTRHSRILDKFDNLMIAQAIGVELANKETEELTKRVEELEARVAQLTPELGN